MSPTVTSEPLRPEVVARLWALPDRVLELVARLTDAGAEALLCGGTARDLMLGLPPADLDLATSATPARVREVLPAAWLADDQPGEAYGTLRVLLDGGEAELTSYRSEAGYDGRRPAAVRFVDDVAVDARRRDFTVNALYVDPLGATVLDPTGGLPDLATRRLRVVGDPMVRFAEDWLRVLRGLRLMAEHGLVADEACWAGLMEAAPLTALLGSERVAQELERLLCSRGRARGLVLLLRSGVAAHVLPGLPPLADVPQPPDFHPEGDVFRHTVQVLANLCEPVPARLAWAALFHDFAKKDTFVVAEDRIRFNDHDRQSVDKAVAWLEDHGCRRQLVEAVADLIREHIRFASVPRFRPARRRRFLDDPAFPDHLAFHRADCLASHRKLGIWAELGREWRALPARPPAPLLKGRDLIALGVPRGPGMGALLAEVEEARLEGRIRDRAEAEEYVLARLEDHSDGAPRASKD